MARINAWFVLIIFSLLGLLVYSNALHAPFLVDDRMFLNDNHKNLGNLWLSFHVNPGDAYYRPLIHIVFKFMYYFFREDSFGYHCVNLILHVLAAQCLFLAIRQIRPNILPALLAGAFYLVHPMNHILINYSTTTCFSLQIIFMLLSLTQINRDVSLFSGVIHREIGRRPYLFSCLFFVLAVFCHESALVLPVFVFIVLYFARRQGFCQSFLFSLPFFVIALGFFVFRMNWARLDVGVLNNFARFDMNVLEYLATFSKLIGWYVGQLVLPDGVVVIWATDVVRHGVGWLCVGALCVGLVCGAMVHLRKFNNSPFLGIVWLAAGLLPLTAACLVEPTRGIVIEPYWLVFSSIGFFIFMADCVASTWAIALVVIVLWSLLTWQYNQLWASPLTCLMFWKNKAPEYSKVSCHLARETYTDKQYNLARNFYAQCVTPKSLPSVIEYHSSLGIMDLQEGKFESAKQHLQAALKLNPMSLSLYTHLGVIAFKENDLAKAKELFTIAMQDKFAILPRLNMASVYKKENNMTGAIQMFEEVLTVDPRLDTAFDGLMRIYFAQNNRSKIIETARRIIAQSRNPQMIANAKRIVQP
jgi:hypothetical protein